MTFLMAVFEGLHCLRAGERCRQSYSTVLCFVSDSLAPQARCMHFALTCAAADLGHQVLGSFVGFKVEWPNALGKSIGWVMNVSTLLKCVLISDFASHIHPVSCTDDLHFLPQGSTS